MGREFFRFFAKKLAGDSSIGRKFPLVIEYRRSSHLIFPPAVAPEVFMHRALAVAALLGLGTMATAAPPDRQKLDAAIHRALTYLERAQERDGAWSHGGTKNAALTALSVMAFMSAGHVPGEGKFGVTLDKGIRWVLQTQRENGLIATQDSYEMYHHGICTLMLAEVAGMTDAKLGAEVRRKLEKAVDVILRAQRTGGEEDGGWRYRADERLETRKPPADISVVGWQVMALRAAKNLGCDVPAERIERAVKYVRRCWDPTSGGFFYTPGFRLSAACTGTGVLSLEICGKNLHRCQENIRAGDYILKAPPRWGGARFFYGVYYCSQAAFQLGGRHWQSYRPELHKALLPNQRADGSWHGLSGEDSTYGPAYGTSMSVLALTVEYRFLPIYQSGEDER
jgi:hypothetical protein